MKRCDQIKELIMTEYIDGLSDKIVIGQVEGHLLDCSECRAFFKDVKNTVVPFEQASQQPVPAELWASIKQSIEQKHQAVNPLEGFMEGLKGLMVFPRLVPVFASLVLMVLVSTVSLNTIQVQQAQAKDQGEYLVSLLSPTAPTESNDGKTPIEQYFL
jgi:predicted anti-sigma-YlaC factor YlaD